jgi:cytoskeleton protein RodZ
MRLFRHRLDRPGASAEPAAEPGPEPRPDPGPGDDVTPEARTGPAGATEAQHLGAALRAARLAAGLGLEEVEARLRIRTAYLAALEEGRLADLPPPAYALGFVRSYARALGLDAEAVARHFRALLNQAPAMAERGFPEPAPERRWLAARTVALLGLVIGLGALAGWYAWPGRDPGLTDPAAPAPEAAVPPAGRLPETPAAAPPQAASGPAAGPDGAAAVAPSARLVLRARGAPAWVQVRAGQGGPVLLSRELQPGESWSAPAREGLLLSTRNAPALEILVDGQPVPGLGSARVVRRDVPLDPERLKAGPMPPPQ